MTLTEVDSMVVRLGYLFNVHVVILAIVATGTFLIAQERLTRPQDAVNNAVVAQLQANVIDAVQNRDIDALIKKTDRTDDKLDVLADQQNSTQRSVDRIVGLGIGFGSALTILQALNVLLQWRTGVKQARG